MLLGTALMVLQAFRTSLEWGLLCLFFPPAGLFYLAKHHQDRAVRRVIFYWILGWAIMIALILFGAFIGRHS